MFRINNNCSHYGNLWKLLALARKIHVANFKEKEKNVYYTHWLSLLFLIWQICKTSNLSISWLRVGIFILLVDLMWWVETSMNICLLIYLFWDALSPIKWFSIMTVCQSVSCIYSPNVWIDFNKIWSMAKTYWLNCKCKQLI